MSSSSNRSLAWCFRAESAISTSQEYRIAKLLILPARRAGGGWWVVGAPCRSYVAAHGRRLTSPRSVRFGLAQDLVQLSDKTKRPQQTVNLRPPPGSGMPPLPL